MLKTLCFKILQESSRRDCGGLGFPEIACFCRVWWYPPITLALGKQAAGPTQVPVQPEIFSETLSQKKRKEKPTSEQVCSRSALTDEAALKWFRGHAYMPALCQDECAHPRHWQVSSERSTGSGWKDSEQANLLAKLGRNWWTNSVGRR